MSPAPRTFFDWSVDSYARGWRVVLRRPSVYPPVLVLALAVAQHFGSRATYVFAFGIAPLLLGLALWSCFVRFRLNQHRFNNPTPPRPGDETLLMQILRAIGCVGIALWLSDLLLHLVVSRWGFLDGVSRWLDGRGGVAAEAFHWSILVWAAALLLAAGRPLVRSMLGRGPNPVFPAPLDLVFALIPATGFMLLVVATMAYATPVPNAGDRETSIPNGQAIAVPGPEFGDDMQLAQVYAPLLRLDRDEAWHPLSIRELKKGPPILVRDTTTTRARLGHPKRLSQLAIRSLACRTAAPCYQLDLTRFADMDCARTPKLAACTPRATVYARVLRAARDQEDFPSEPAPGPAVGVLIEYWVLYGYDSWNRETPFGLVQQHHDGDWEAVFVAFSPKRIPIWAGFTSHCGGVVERWTDVHVDDHHLVSFVAQGSHANYPSRASQAPDWLGCVTGKARSTELALVDGLSNIREQVDPPGPLKDTMVPNVVLAPRQPLLSAPLWWGTGETITVSGTTLLHGDDGPESPGCKPLWRRPLSVIFCDSKWQTDSHLTKHSATFCNRWRPPSGLDCGAA
jgi:hypothetical protein